MKLNNQNNFHHPAASNSSWFSIGSFSNFQAGGIMDPRAMNRAPRVSVIFVLIMYYKSLKNVFF